MKLEQFKKQFPVRAIRPLSCSVEIIIASRTMIVSIERASALPDDDQWIVTVMQTIKNRPEPKTIMIARAHGDAYFDPAELSTAAAYYAMNPTEDDEIFYVVQLLKGKDAS